LERFELLERLELSRRTVQDVQIVPAVPTVVPMLTNLRVILVRPRGSGNIGSVARAMKNIGAGELAIVGKGRTQSFWARAMAVHGRDILAEAKSYASIREAVADCTMVVGTTCRSGLYRSHSQTPREVAPAIITAAQKGKVALLFGPEDHGLSNKDLAHCQLLVTIPTHPDYPSLNVAQAVVVCLYEIYLASLAPATDDGIQRAEGEHVERLFDIMRTSLLKIGFLDSENPEHMLLAFRRIFGRAGLEEKDVRILTGMFRQIEWYAKEGRKVVQEKERRGIKIR
jgi:tRNA/rRNA methyltransferase